MGAVLLWAGAAAAQDLPRPLTDDDFLPFDMEQAAIGHQLFYDPILSGNQNITCAHCHHPDFGTSDGLSLGIGEGGVGLGPDRTPGTGADRIRKRIPRNAPGLWNLGAKDIHTLFHDGRLSKSDIYDNGFNSPAQEWLPEGLNSLLAAQALFPLTAQFEMAGNVAENQVTGAVHDRIDMGWPILAKRVRTDPRYGSAMVDAFDDVETAKDITITQIANALAAFMAIEWRSTDSPFDQYLAGDTAALSATQKNGMDLFYGKARCATCHSGPLMSDQKFHALGLPPFGPGRTRQWDPFVRDVGRMGESNRLEDAYRFRTPMLRNVALTAPYGHNGAFPDLESMIRHHLNPESSLSRWERAMAALPQVPWLQKADFVVWDDRFEMERQRNRIDIAPVELSDAEIDNLVAFLNALTGTSVDTLPFGVPAGFIP
ncbi:cytochrome c peroxidase [uncultured Ruegeria sp.]|uniref:cytochrome-c peroxidase n=1 Tax=uncultured Ruegeria sp. TaxID=259304 RepID=UPI00260A93E5|nr:cytochrome c peroxidase [uncultured Ruegeria sp.]